MKLLLLGGTAFLGSAIVRAALTRGHEVTCVARGSAPPPDGAAFVAADRDSPGALSALRDVHWDAVIDVSRQPGQVKRATEQLHARHWVFVSSLSVYAQFDGLEQDEASPVLAPLESDTLTDLAEYGSAKVACENAIRAADGTSTIIRSGLIAGPGDITGRVGYYPWRFAHPSGPDVLTPPDLSFPCAFIDVDDIAAWAVSSADQRIDGTYNATGHTSSLGEVLEGAKQVARSEASIRPVTEELLKREGVNEWMGPQSLPLWGSDPAWRYFATLDCTAARAAGLRTRPIHETLTRALAYENQRTHPRGAGLTDAEEIALRAALTTA